MPETINLPTDKLALANVIERHAEREEYRLSYRRAIWTVALWYLLGAREFHVFNPDSGEVAFTWLDNEGKLEFQSQEMLSAVDRVAGRLSSVDLRPLVTRTGDSLSQIRQRAVAQVIADSLINEQSLGAVTPQLAHIFTLLGSVGMQGHIVDHPTIGLTNDLEIIHPKELFPFPSLGEDYTKQRGIMRQRIVPIQFLKDRFGRRIMDNHKKMLVWEKQIGDQFDTEVGDVTAGVDIQFTQQTNAMEAGDKTQYQVVKVRELWVNGPGDLCARYVMASGDYIIEDIDTEGLEVYCPIGFARFMENGSFHGAGVFDLLFSVVREAEKMAKQLFQNIADIDRYGVLVMPHGSFSQNTMLRDVGRGLRVFPWEPDPISEGFRPFAITPFNSGDMPGKVAQFAIEQIDRVNPLQDLVREKGRVDSAIGLSFLDEQINRAMTTPSRGMQKLFGMVYRAITSDATREVMLSPRAIPVGHLTTDLAGAVIDPDSLEVTFRDNPLPDVSRLNFGVRQTHPRSEVARKQEALELQQRLQIDPDSFILFATKEGLDFAMWADEHQAAYETVVRNIVFLFGDGQTPGRVILVPEQAKPELQLRVLSAFMAGPVMMAASVEVQNEFIQYKRTLQEFLGMVLPTQVPNPDDLALLTRIEQQVGGLGPQGQAALPQGQPQLPQGAVA